MKGVLFLFFIPDPDTDRPSGEPLTAFAPRPTFSLRQNIAAYTSDAFPSSSGRSAPITV